MPARGLWLLAVLCLCGPPWPWPAGAETVEGLAARLDEAIHRVDAARSENARPADPIGLFPESEEVTWGDQTIQIEHAGVRAEWRGVPAEGGLRRQALDRFRARLAAVRAELAPGGPEQTANGRPAASSTSGLSPGQTARHGGVLVPPPARWRERLTEILSRPEFRKLEAREGSFASLIKWLRDKLEFLLPSGTGPTLNKILSWVLYVLAAAAILFVLIVLVRVALPLLRIDGRLAQPGATLRPAQPDTPQGLLALAEARSRAGDWRGAVQAIFRWLLLRLHLAGRLDYDPALTNREHLARLRADAAARAAFVELSGQFELAWYALRPVRADDYAQFRARCQQLAEGTA